MWLCVSSICCTIQVVCSSEKAIFPMMRWHTHKRLLFSMSETVFVPRQSLEWVEENFYLFLIFIICISSHVCTFRVRWGGRDITSLPHMPPIPSPYWFLTPLRNSARCAMGWTLSLQWKKVSAKRETFFIYYSTDACIQEEEHGGCVFFYYIGADVSMNFFYLQEENDKL